MHILNRGTETTFLVCRRQEVIDIIFIAFVFVLTAYRLNCQEVRNNTGLGHTESEFFQKYHFTLQQDRIHKKYPLVNQYKILIPTREDRCVTGKIAYSNIDVCYTDRAGTNSRFVIRTGQELTAGL